METKKFNSLQEWYRWNIGTYTGEIEVWNNGVLRKKCNYKNGKLHGMHEWWDEIGEWCEKSCYRNGELHRLFGRR